MSKIAAIPTVYRGIQMRSRLESKWAYVFDALGWRWEYEPIDLNGWIPDFVLLGLKDFNKPCLVEIKPIFDYHDDRATIIKIEQALGAPKPAELRGPNECYDSDGWERFYENLKYEVLLLGAKPIEVEITDGYWVATGKPVVIGTALSIGWRLGPGMGWDTDLDLAKQRSLKKAWKHATNSSQWRARR